LFTISKLMLTQQGHRCGETTISTRLAARSVVRETMLSSETAQLSRFNRLQVSPLLRLGQVLEADPRNLGQAQLPHCQ
jgi:hypothetical protein